MQRGQRELISTTLVLPPRSARGGDASAGGSWSGSNICLYFPVLCADWRVRQRAVQADNDRPNFFTCWVSRPMKGNSAAYHHVRCCN